MRSIAASILTGVYWYAILKSDERVQRYETPSPDYPKSLQNLVWFGVFLFCVTAFLITIGA